MNPEHAADRSNPHARVAPRLLWTRQAVAGNIISGVTLATTIRSISEAGTFLLARTSRAAAVARSEEATPFSTTWRSRMPVRSRIHASLVSTSFSNSALDITRGGTYPVTPVIFAAIRLDIP